MPYKGEHSARINPPGKYEKLRRQNNKFGKGIHVIFGVLKEGGTEVQSIHFDSEKFSEEQARAWLKEQDYKPIEFEPALEEEEDEREAEPAKPGNVRYLSGEPANHRFLSIELTPASDIQEIDGGLLVPGVKLLAPGVWTDSTQNTPCRYTEDILKRYAANWTDYSYWSRHSGGTPRDITDRIADIRNVRYQDGVTADLFYHGTTSKSQDTIALVKAAAAGKVPWPYSSVEMYTRDKWIVSEKLHEAQEVLFDGAAMVHQGACRTCRIRNNELGQWVELTGDPEGKLTETPSHQQDPPLPEGIDQMTDTKELDAAISTATAPLLEKIKALEAKIAPPEPAKVEIPKELTESIAAIDERLKKLEKGPGEIKTKPTRHDLEPDLPEYYVPVNRKTGTVGSEA